MNLVVFIEIEPVNDLYFRHVTNLYAMAAKLIYWTFVENQETDQSKNKTV